MAEVVFDAATKIYGDGTRAVDALSLQVPDGKLIALVGPSGCGKTSALRMVAGLEPISEGSIRVGDKIVNRLPSKERDVAMVFQNYALYPHMTVYDNIAFSLKLRRLKKAAIDEQVKGVAETLGLAELLRKKPGQLSGGQRQRVAMGRAIVRRPAAFLMDEPLSNLDAKLRVQMRAEIAQLQKRLGVTTLFVTHDQTEALTLGDLVAVMRSGILLQVATPQTLYDKPKDVFVASFIGSPGMNLVAADVDGGGGTVMLRFGQFQVDLGTAAPRFYPGLERYIGHQVVLGIRPEVLEELEASSGNGGDHAQAQARIRTRIDLREVMGPEVFLHFSVDAPRVVSDDMKGETVEESANRFIARVSARTTAQEGDVVEFGIDTSRLHVFDIESGEAIGGPASA